MPVPADAHALFEQLRSIERDRSKQLANLLQAMVLGADADDLDLANAGLSELTQEAMHARERLMGAIRVLRIRAK